MESVTEKLANFVVGTKFDDLPREVVDKVKQVLLDSVGCALGGYITDRGRLAIEFAVERGGNPQASIIGGHRTSYDLAAFVNGELINALDYDVIGPCTGHVYPYVAPPCLAIAERVHASGKELILALALAQEIGGRVASSLIQHRVLKDEPPYYEEYPRFSFSTTLLGGVAGAGRLFEFDAYKMRNALGIAGASCPVPGGQKWETITGPAIMVKYNAWAGWCSQLATVATLLAEKRFTGDTTILDGERGFWVLVGSPFFKPENLLGGLGKVWHILDSALKLYPTCQINQAGIQAIHKIIREHNIKPGEIEGILVKGDPLYLTPNRTGMKVTNFGDMQFLNAYIFAAAILYDDIAGPAWQMPSVFDRPELKVLAKKVKVELHPRTSEVLAKAIKTGIGRPFILNVVVEITARGEKFTAEEVAPKGDPTNPVTEDEILAKFRNNASFSMLPSSRVELVIKMISQLEEVDDITELTKLLTTG